MASQRGDIEKVLHKKNLIVAGVDEVGRGCIAGPVFAGAVILTWEAIAKLPTQQKELLRDSKTLTLIQRKKMAEVVKLKALAHGVGSADVAEIEGLGIVNATFLAMHRAIAKLNHRIDYLLIDGNQPLPNFLGKQKAIIKGDNLCYCIAGASIIAKTSRDNFKIGRAHV